MSKEMATPQVVELWNFWDSLGPDEHQRGDLVVVVDGKVERILPQVVEGDLTQLS